MRQHIRTGPNDSPPTLSAEEFVRRLRAYTTGDYGETQYALFIGAGCSVTSGVPGAGSLIRDHWIPRLRDVCAPNEDNAQEWVTSEFGIDSEQLPPGAYARILTELLPYPALRQAEFELRCGNGRPRFGYATLAQLMADSEGRFNVVLTTNFDDLIADSLYLFAGVHPLVIHHGALSPFIRATRTRPLVIKLHGHHQYSPLNTLEETQSIEPGLAAGVRSLLHDRGLIFIGYSGNDTGIRDILQDLPPEALPYGVFWVNGREPDGPIRPWLIERGAHWVKHHDFDELMVHIRDAFGLTMPDLKRVSELFDNVQRDYLLLSEKIHAAKSTSPAEIALRNAAERVDRTVRDWAVYELRTQRFRDSDPERAKAAYREGLSVIPDSVPLHGNFANYLKDLGELDEAEQHYLRALEIDPEYAIVLHDYGIFLWRFRGNTEKARGYISHAMKVDSGDDGVRLSNYANFLWEVEKDIAGADRLFRRSIGVPSTGHEAFSQYAFFALIELGDYHLADDLAREAIRRKPNDISSLTYRAHLATHAGDIEAAKEMLERAYAVDDENIPLLGAFASFLWRQQANLARAQAMFEAAKELTPRNHWETRRRAMIIIDYAKFLAQERGAEEEGWRLVEEASKVYPGDLLFIVEKASFLGHQMGRADAALELIEGAISSYGEDASLLGVKAGLLSQHNIDREHAAHLYRRAIDLEPGGASFLANLAGLLFAEGNAGEALPLCLAAVRRAGRLEPGLAVECFFYLFAHGPQSGREHELGTLKWMMTEGVRSKGWDLSPNVDRAVADGHPNAEWLPRLASVITAGEDVSMLSGWPEWDNAPLPSFTALDGEEPE